MINTNFPLGRDIDSNSIVDIDDACFVNEYDIDTIEKTDVYKQAVEISAENYIACTAVDAELQDEDVIDVVVDCNASAGSYGVNALIDVLAEYSGHNVWDNFMQAVENIVTSK